MVKNFLLIQNFNKKQLFRKKERGLGMTIIYGNDPIKFHTQVERLLLEKEAENNLPLGILQRMIESKREAECHLVHIQEQGVAEFMSLRTPPHLWILPSLKDNKPVYVKEFVRFLSEYRHEVPGILGERQAVQWFVEEWSSLTGQEAELQMEQGIHRLDRLRNLKKQKGELVEADFSHRKLIEDWIRQYGIETGEAHVASRVEELTEELVADSRLHLWLVDGEPVSMASRARTTKNGATINAVFTPDEYKRNGYASQAVWHLTEKLLKDGFSFCSLYTDLANGTSNSIYKKIGYERVGDSVVYHFRNRISGV